MSSLRRRLVLALITGLMVVGALASIGLYLEATEEVNEQFDDRLRAIAASLSAESLTATSLPRDGDETAESDDGIVAQVWDTDGSLRVHTSKDIAPFPIQLGLANLIMDDTHWRSFAHKDANGQILQVAQSMKLRRVIAVESALMLLLPGLALLPLMALLTSWIVTRQLRPLRHLEALMDERTAEQQGQVNVPDAPSELVPVIKALNNLLQRQQHASEQQRAFLADAAHELRTPLAVVRLQAQRAQRATSHSEQREALGGLQAGVERATRLVTQLLGMARSEHGSKLPPQPLDFTALLRQTLAELHPLAAEKRIDLGLTEADSCHLRGHADTLKSLITNLIDNAIRYTPEGGRVDVSLRLVNSEAELSISDTGPGIPADRRAQLFERFVRAGQADTIGSGLGLAIARQVAEKHGGSVAIQAEQEGLGLGLIVRLPASMPEALPLSG